MNLLAKAKKDLKSRPWIVERMPGVLNSIYIPANALMRDLKKIGLDWSLAYFGIKDEFLTIMFPEDREIEIGNIILRRELKNPGYYQKIIKENSGARSVFAR